MASLNCTHNLTVQYNCTETLRIGAVSATIQDNITAQLQFNNGTGAAGVNQHCEETPVTLAAGASVTYLLSGLTDSIVRTIPFLHIQSILIYVTSRTAGDYLLVGDPTASVAHAWTSFLNGATQAFKVFDIFAIGVGGTVDGYAVASGANDQLVVKNAGANPITFTIAFQGRDA